jgi:hypothetical protein
MPPELVTAHESVPSPTRTFAYSDLMSVDWSKADSLYSKRAIPILTPSRHSDRGVPPRQFFVWFSEGSPNRKKAKILLQNRDRKFFSDAAISTKSGLLETLQHMVVRCLRGEL